jgi:hypothetical protein
MKFSSTIFLTSIIVSTLALPFPHQSDDDEGCDEPVIGSSTVTSLASVPTGNNLAAGDGAAGLSLQEIDALTPQFGHDANVNPTGTGDCDGAVNGADGKPIKVPCACPPPRDQFIQVRSNVFLNEGTNN